MRDGRVTAFLVVVLFAIGMYYFLEAMKKGMKYPLRRVAGLEAIKEAVGRATELGRPVFFSAGIGDVVGAEGMQVLAGMDILSFVAKMCAEYNVRVISTVCKENVQAVTEEVVRSAYAAAGRKDAYQPEMVQFLSPTQMAYTAASVGIMRREKIAASLLIGPFFGEALIMAEAAAEIGAIGIAGTARMSQLPLFVAACDYTLIGEEMFAGSAYLTGDPMSVGNIVVQDITKMAAIVCVVLGSLLRTVNNNFLHDLLGR